MQSTQVPVKNRFLLIPFCSINCCSDPQANGHWSPSPDGDWWKMPGVEKEDNFGASFGPDFLGRWP